jgi:hypothetical protein
MSIFNITPIKVSRADSADFCAVRSHTRLPAQSQSDENEYRYVTLEYKLQV